jgi:hypothetical protein
MVIFLKAIGWLCLIGGVLLAFISVAVHQSADAIRNLIDIIAADLVGSILWFALAIIIQRVERWNPFCWFNKRGLQPTR